MLQASADLIRCEQRLSIKVDSAAHKRDATTKHASVQVHPNKLRLPYVLLFSVINVHLIVIIVKKHFPLIMCFYCMFVAPKLFRY